MIRKAAETNRDQRTARASHADHEMSQFLLLHAEMRSERHSHLPGHVRRAIHVAYATRLRSVLEFIRDEKTPRRGSVYKIPDPPRDIKLSEFRTEAAETEWGRGEIRLCWRF